MTTPNFTDWEQDRPLTMAFADPPYIGQAKRHYSDDPQCAEVDHEELIERLCRDYPFGWALSCSSPSLRIILPLCPEEARVGAWVKPFCSFKPNVNPAYAWEPVIFCGGRKKGREVATTRDWCAANITLQRGCAGAKPDAFCVWLFEMLGLRKGDTLVDLYPGSGAVTRAWEAWTGQTRISHTQMDLFAAVP